MINAFAFFSLLCVNLPSCFLVSAGDSRGECTRSLVPGDPLYMQPTCSLVLPPASLWNVHWLDPSWTCSLQGAATSFWYVFSTWIQDGWEPRQSQLANVLWHGQSRRGRPSLCPTLWCHREHNQTFHHPYSYPSRGGAWSWVRAGRRRPGWVQGGKRATWPRTHLREVIASGATRDLVP